MNIKVIIIWIIAIIACVVLGVLGYSNRDLLEIENKYNSNKEYETHTCHTEFGSSESIYSFQIADNKIESMSITYKSSSTDEDGYNIASKLSTIDKYNSVFYGDVDNFYLMITISSLEHDKEYYMEGMEDDFTKLYILIDSITDYEEYKTAISNFAEYSCE